MIKLAALVAGLCLFFPAMGALAVTIASVHDSWINRKSAK